MVSDCVSGRSHAAFFVISDIVLIGKAIRNEGGAGVVKERSACWSDSTSRRIWPGFVGWGLDLLDVDREVPQPGQYFLVRFLSHALHSIILNLASKHNFQIKILRSVSWNRFIAI